MIYLVYERATGRVVGDITADSKPVVLAHHNTVEVPALVGFDTVRVVNGLVRTRTALNFDAPAAGAMISVNDGPAMPAVGYVVPTQPGTYRIVALGDFMGERTVVVRTLVDEQAYLTGLVKSLAATKKMAAISPGTAKPEEYRLKAPEIAASANVVAGVLNGLTAANALIQYPAAATEAKLSGEPLATVLARYRRGSAASDKEVIRLSSIEHTAVTRIGAATTVAQAQAAYAAINWNWKP